MQNSPIKMSPKDFFLYVFAAGSLYFSAVTLITLLWQLINHWFPMPAGMDYYYEAGGISSTLRWSVALLLVIFPAYIVAMRWIGKDIDSEPAKNDFWVRRWFIYATLFIAAVTLLGDLSFLVYTLLGGDVASRFILKALSVAIVAGGVFGYHLFLLRREPGTAKGTRKVIAAIASVAVAASVIGAIMVTGSPSDARAERNDQTRVSNLQDIQWQTTTYWELKQRLPETSAELIDPANPMPLPVDPVTGASYRFEKTGDRAFRLCATFEADFKDSAGGVETMSYPIQVSWAHGVGETCFDRSIDPERYPKPAF